MRVLHFSDVHVHLPLRKVPLRDWRGRRLFGGLPVALHRGHTFLGAGEKLAALVQFGIETGIDLALCSGDYSELATEEELRIARRTIEPLRTLPHGYVGIPGNHDVYYAGNRDRYLDAFADTHQTDCPDARVDGTWPLVRLADDRVAVIALDAVQKTLPEIGASGEVPRAQLNALRSLLATPEIAARFVFVMLHYTPCLADGGPDRPSHRLKNATEFLAACAGARRGAIVAGHVHHRFYLGLEQTPLPLFCAGSATQTGREGGWVFDIAESSASARETRWRDGGYELLDEPALSW